MTRITDNWSYVRILDAHGSSSDLGPSAFSLDDVLLDDASLENVRRNQKLQFALRLCANRLRHLTLSRALGAFQYIIYILIRVLRTCCVVLDSKSVLVASIYLRAIASAAPPAHRSRGRHVHRRQISSESGSRRRFPAKARLQRHDGSDVLAQCVIRKHRTQNHAQSRFAILLALPFDVLYVLILMIAMPAAMRTPNTPRFPTRKQTAAARMDSVRLRGHDGEVVDCFEARLH